MKNPIIATVNNQNIYCDRELRDEIVELRRGHLINLITTINKTDTTEDIINNSKNKDKLFTKDIKQLINEYLEVKILGAYLKDKDLIDEEYIRYSLGFNFNKIKKQNGSDIAADFKQGIVNEDGSIKFRVLRPYYQELLLDSIKITDGDIDGYIKDNPSTLINYTYSHLSLENKEITEKLFKEFIGENEDSSLDDFFRKLLADSKIDDDFVSKYGRYNYRSNDYNKFELDLKDKYPYKNHLLKLDAIFSNLKESEITKPFYLDEKDRIPEDYSYHMVEVISKFKYDKNDPIFRGDLKLLLKKNIKPDLMNKIFSKSNIDIFPNVIKSIQEIMTILSKDNQVIARVDGKDHSLKYDRIFLDIHKNNIEKYYHINKHRLEEIGFNDSEIRTSLKNRYLSLVKNSIKNAIFYSEYTGKCLKYHYPTIKLENEIKASFDIDTTDIKIYIEENKDSLSYIEYNSMFFDNLKDAENAYEFLSRTYTKDFKSHKLMKKLSISKFDHANFFEIELNKDLIEPIIDKNLIYQIMDKLDVGEYSKPMELKRDIFETSTHKIIWIERKVKDPCLVEDKVEELMRNELFNQKKEDILSKMDIDICFDDRETLDFDSPPGDLNAFIFFPTL